MPPKNHPLSEECTQKKNVFNSCPLLKNLGSSSEFGHSLGVKGFFVVCIRSPRLLLIYPLSQNDYRQEKSIFELFSGALQENPVIAPGATTLKKSGDLFLSAVVAPFAPVRIFGGNFWP